MENTNKKSWRDVTINEYFDLVERLNEKGLNYYEKEIIKISFITGLSEDEIWEMNINEFRNAQSESLWMNEFKINENVSFNKIKINDLNYKIDTNLQNFTVAQYVDFQTFYTKFKTNQKTIGNILACFIIPNGKKYADGYDIQKVIKDINENLDILTAEEIMFFFLKKYLISIRATANYFNWILKRMKKKTKDQKETEKIEKNWEKMKAHTLDGLRLLTM